MRRIIWFLKIFPGLAMIIAPYLSTGQVFTGSITDHTKLFELPYANISVRGKSVGGISDARGKFKIDITKAAITDTITVSYLGYQSMSYLKRDIVSSFYEIKLIPVSYDLNEVVAKGKRKIVAVLE